MDARVAEDVTKLIGNTPLVRLNRVTRGIRARVYAKLEFFNPGGSVKDRIGLSMLLDAERKGLVKPGYTIVEPTSGNTGMGLAIVGIMRGYKMVCTVPDKVSKDKVDLLRAVGATVHVTPTNVATDHPDSYIMVAKKIAKETPNSYMPNQYQNLANTEAHYRTTGPEIWQQTNGAVDFLVAGVGTGGTITGTGRYLKEKKPGVKVVGVDPVGSILAAEFKGKSAEPHTYRVEGIGEDFVPKTLDLRVIDRMITVTDEESFLAARRLAREEGIVAGGSSGTALVGALRVAKNLGSTSTVVVILPDSGRSYTDKMFNDEWMQEQGFLESKERRVSVDAILRSKPEALHSVIAVRTKDPITRAIDTMTKHDVSQLPVVEGGIQVGSVTVASIVKNVVAKKKTTGTRVRDIMDPPLPTVEKGGVLMHPGGMTRDRNAVVVVEGSKVVGVITAIDVINYLATR